MLVDSEGSPSKWRIPQWFPDLEPQTIERLRTYQDELLRWTVKINLISRGTINDVDRVHIADGILGAKIILEKNPALKEVWDIGSGNGIPGVIFSILAPQLKVICIDSDQRKISFLKQVCVRLELKNLSARCERFETIAKHAVPVAVARGFAAIDKALELGEEVLEPQGRFFHFKGPDWKQEAVMLSPRQNQRWNTENIGEYSLPMGESAEIPALRAIILNQKV